MMRTMLWTYKDAPLEGVPSQYSATWEHIPGLTLHEDGYYRLSVVSEEWLARSPHLVREDSKAWFVLASVSVSFGYGDAADAVARVLYIDEEIICMLWWDEHNLLAEPRNLLSLYGSRGQAGPPDLLPPLTDTPIMTGGRRNGTLPSIVKDRIVNAVWAGWSDWPAEGTRRLARQLKDGSKYWFTVPYRRTSKIITGDFSLSGLIKGGPPAGFKDVVFRRGDIIGPKTVAETISRNADWLRRED